MSVREIPTKAPTYDLLTPSPGSKASGDVKEVCDCLSGLHCNVENVLTKLIFQIFPNFVYLCAKDFVIGLNPAINAKP